MILYLSEENSGISGLLDFNIFRLRHSLPISPVCLSMPSQKLCWKRFLKNVGLRGRRGSKIDFPLMVDSQESHFPGHGRFVRICRKLWRS